MSAACAPTSQDSSCQQRSHAILVRISLRHQFSSPPRSKVEIATATSAFIWDWKGGRTRRNFEGEIAVLERNMVDMKKRN